MVLWGSNTTHTFQTQTPASSGFGSNAATSPAPAFTYGSTTANTPAPSTGFGGSSAFGGTPAPTPGGGLFGGATSSSTPAPTSFFGSSTPAPAGGLFGNNPAPAPFGTTFGAPSSGGLFGSAPSTSLFGAPLQQQQAQQQQQQQQHQLPAHAAMQAHIDASNRQEQARIANALTKLYQQYTGTHPATEDKSSPFTQIIYNQATPEYQQLQYLHGMWASNDPSSGQQQLMRRPVSMPQPPQVSIREWEQATVRNPDYNHYMPGVLVGAEHLQERLSSQQERANSVVDQLKALDECREAIQKRHDRVKVQMNVVLQRQIRQRQKLVDVMKRVEVFRSYNTALQPDEIKAMQKATHLYQETDQLASAMESLETLAAERIDRAAETQEAQSELRAERSHEIPDESELKEVLSEHRDELSKLVGTVTQDLRDLDLIQRRLEATTAPRIALPSRRV